MQLLTVLFAVLFSTLSFAQSHPELDCSNAVIAPSDAVIEPLRKDLYIMVDADQTGLSPYRFQFYVVDKAGRPMPQVSVTPLLSGQFNKDFTAQELEGDSRWYGVNTPPSQWCSDSSGLITIWIAPAISEDEDQTEGKITLRSGSILSNAIELTLLRG